MSKHTPTPWKIVRPRPGYEQDCGILADGIPGVIAETFCRIHAADVIEPEIALSNAEFIVTACNAYGDDRQTIAELTSALEKIGDVLSNARDPYDAANACLNITAAVLKKAKGE